MFAQVSQLETLQNAPAFEDMPSSNQKMAKMELEKLKSRKKALASQLSQAGLSVHKIIDTAFPAPSVRVGRVRVSRVRVSRVRVSRVRVSRVRVSRVRVRVSRVRVSRVRVSRVRVSRVRVSRVRFSRVRIRVRGSG